MKLKPVTWKSHIAPSTLVFLFSLPASAAVVDIGGLADVAANEQPNIEHCDASVGTFIDAFECGDELFEVRFNALDGVGMDVGDGGRFARGPRADLINWSTTTPMRATGPNAEACNICHTTETIGGAGDGAGPVGLNVIRDPLHTAFPGTFIQRNTPHLFGMAGPQLLAEEMTVDLQDVVNDTIAYACQTGYRQTSPLTTKGINFGEVKVRPRYYDCDDDNDRSNLAAAGNGALRNHCSDDDWAAPDLMTSMLNRMSATEVNSRRHNCLDNAKVRIHAEGISDDLIVRPFQWKGNEPTVRSFSRGAFHNELGMTPVELSGDNIDSDFDGIIDEISIADVTAMAVYLAGQPRPTSLLELHRLRRNLINQYGIDGEEKADELGLKRLTNAERSQIRRGRRVFRNIGCADCHSPRLKVNNPIFSEPSQNAAYRDAVFPGGQNAVARGVDPNNPLTFDITQDQPDNIIEVNGNFVTHLGAFETDYWGRAIVRLYGDLKLHDMGPGLAENIDETGAGASVWMTKELWGLGNTAPYLHDGRATTIEEAIIEHGGEGADSSNYFASLSNANQDALIAFLKNLVLFFPSEEE